MLLLSLKSFCLFSLLYCQVHNSDNNNNILSFSSYRVKYGTITWLFEKMTGLDVPSFMK